MITKNEISSLNLSPTKKDFVQIWNELLEVASKITERWDPTSTNESDPGIVLLKVLTGIADKLNYNIDKNILEAYMPTAAQMESMRKLCELVGYDIKYYQSATTRVTIKYTGNTTNLTDENTEKLPDGGLAIPKFTTITNADKDIAFITTNKIPALLTNATPYVTVDCIEGQISQCESSNEHNLITHDQLDDNNRYYLPEVQIAENGIFVYNVTETLEDGTAWKQVSNLNTQSRESRVFKFGYDSFEGRPYLAFPDDIGSLIGDGLFIYFTRTSGLSGNISPRTLEVIELPTGNKWGKWEDYSAEQFEVINVDATSNGANIESISAAYNNFKKTVGTFDTLVTCRDYMNKIYSLMDANNSPYVSNILVTDIRNDINSAITLCSCNEFGILYKEMPLYEPVEVTAKAAADYALKVIETSDETGQIINKLVANTPTPFNYTIEEPRIDHFDLVLYPFKTFTQVSSGTKDLTGPYNKSFTYTEQPLISGEIEAALADIKTCAHKLIPPAEGDIVSINNYLRLNALIATSTRVSEIESNDILKNVKVALVNAFNLRNLDFGEEIPFDSILSVIENADSRIKVVSLQEPTLLTTYSIKEKVDGIETSVEYGIASTSEDRIKGVKYTYKEKDEVTGEEKEEEKEYVTAKDAYNRLVLRNILAGRASLFNYDETFIANNSEKPYTITQNITDVLKLAKKTTEFASMQAAFEYFERITNALDSALSEEELAIKKAINNVKSLGLFNEDALEKAKSILEVGKETFKNKPIGSTVDCILYNDNEPIKGFSDGIITLNATPIEKPDPADPDKSIKDIDIIGAYETYEPGFEVEPAKDSTESLEKPEKVKGGVIDNIDHIEASCELKNIGEVNPNIFQNIELAKNEVIKFRAPNLITTTTYPAYVYYRFEKGYYTTNPKTGQNTPVDSESTPQTYRLGNIKSTSSTGGTSGDSDSGSYAKVMTLASFINAYADNNGDAADETQRADRLKEFFNELWKTAGKDAIKTFRSTPKGKDSDEPIISGIQQSGSLQDVFNASIAVGTNEESEINLDDTKKIFTSVKEFTDYLTKKSEDGHKDPITFKYYPIQDSTKSIWEEHVREKYKELYKNENKSLTEPTTFWRLSVTSGHPMGKYVTESGQRMYAQGGDFLLNSVVATTTYLCDKEEVGANPVFASIIPDGADVELKPSSSGKSSGGTSGDTSGGDGSGSNTVFVGDRLYIHYTPSSTNEDGETVQSEPILKVYESTEENPIIIKPSGLTLIPSEAVNSQGTSWKKTGVDFGKYGPKDLLALAPNEQIEIRSISRVILDSPAKFYKNFENKILEDGNVNEQPYSYELKDGEYIFYTDQNASDAAYYGSGSVITVEGGAKIPKATDTVEVSQILEKGLHIVPWSRIELLGDKKKVTITEYQYVTLAEGDTLNTLTLEGSAGNVISSDKWTQCIQYDETTREDIPIIYTPAGSETSITLPKIDIKSELGSGRSTSWEVRSFLELSTSPGYAQPLRAAQAKTANGPVEIRDTVKLHTQNKTGANNVVVITPQKTVLPTKPDAEIDFYEPVSIKLDTIAQVASGNFKKETSGTSDSSVEDTLISAKVFKEEAPTILEFDASQEITPMSNINSYLADSKNNITDIINNYWTKLDIANALVDDSSNNNSTSEEGAKVTAKALKLNFLIPDNIDNDIFGIFSIYLDVPGTSLDSEKNKQFIPKTNYRIYFEVPKEFGSYKDVISIYNCENYIKADKDTGWWLDGIENNRLYLRAGLNCVKVKKSCSLLIRAEKEAEGNLVYDNLRLVKGQNIQGINLELLDFKNTSSTAEAVTDEELAKAVLTKIAELDKNYEFYYNTPIENSLAIEFDKNIKSFSNPYTLYDVNNINKDFVISKLDIADLEGEDSGLKIAKSSRY